MIKIETIQDPKTAQEVLLKKMHAIMTLDFILERFTDFIVKDKNWREKLKPLQKEFQDYLDVTAPGEEPTASVMVDHGLMFMATHPMFGASEYIKLGAILTDAEKKKFAKELKAAIERPSKSQHILPYIAAVGYTLITLLLKEDNLREQVEKKRAEITEMLAVGLVKTVIKDISAPIIRGIRMIEKLEEAGITIDNEGGVTDEKGLLKKEKEVKSNYTKYAGDTGKENTTGESPESIQPAPEDTN